MLHGSQSRAVGPVRKSLKLFELNRLSTHTFSSSIVKLYSRNNLGKPCDRVVEGKGGSGGLRVGEAESGEREREDRGRKEAMMDQICEAGRNHK